MISWGFKENHLSGLELDSNRAEIVQLALPNAELKIGNAVNLPWDSNKFDFVVPSTVFSSILKSNVSELIAQEIKRVLKPEGGLIWYDLAVNNPNNTDVKGVKTKELNRLFPDFNSKIHSVTLAPPIARFITPKSITLACILNSIPFLRTNLIGILIKK